MLQGNLLYYYLCEHFQGEPLSAVLSQNPQLWINHVGWLMISLAITINKVHRFGLCHCGLNPGSLLVRFDDKPNVPRIFLFDLGIAGSKPELAQAWYPFCVPPAYTAPELIDGRARSASGDYRTDVYGLGLLLYEMLVGMPPFKTEGLGDAEVYQAVERGERVPMVRVEDVERVAQIALRATSPELAARQPTAVAFAEELAALFGKVPEPKKRSWPGQRTLLMAIFVCLTIAFLVVLAMILSGTGPS